MEDDEYEMKDFTYYARIVMMIVLAIQLILFIVFIVVIYGVESDMDKLIFNLSKISLFRYKNLDEMEDDFIFKSEQKQGHNLFCCFLSRIYNAFRLREKTV